MTTTVEDIPQNYRDFAKETKALMEDKIDSQQKDTLKQFVGKVMSDETTRNELKEEREAAFKQCDEDDKGHLGEEEWIKFVKLQRDNYEKRGLPPLPESEERSRKMFNVCQFSGKGGISLEDLDIKMKYDGILLKAQLEAGEKWIKSI